MSDVMPRFAAVIVDYGGVLTSSTRDSMGAFCETDDVDPADFQELMREWLTPGNPVNPVHQLETGEITGPEFEVALAARLRTRGGQPLVVEGLLSRMFAASREQPVLVDALHLAKASGLKIGLLSNSWANDYPTHLWNDLFDDMVVSGEVGLRKPAPEIYTLAASRLGVDPAACIFVDDISPNIKGAVSVGMTGILHTDPQITIGELEILLELHLRDRS